MGRLLHLVHRGGLWAAAAPPSRFLAVPNVTAHPSTASVPTSYYSMWHCFTFAHEVNVNIIYTDLTGWSAMLDCIQLRTLMWWIWWWWGWLSNGSSLRCLDDVRPCPSGSCRPNMVGGSWTTLDGGSTAAVSWPLVLATTTTTTPSKQTNSSNVRESLLRRLHS